MQKLVHLQGLRAIAASLVIANHAVEYMIRRQVMAESWGNFGVSLGWIGVGVFFVISGFIMVRTSWDRFGSTAESGRFILNRIIRIVPIYYIATAIFMFPLILRSSLPSLEHTLASLAFIPYLDPAVGLIRPVLGQGWTLNYEMLFYVVFALCLNFSKRTGVAVIVLVFPVLVLAGAAFRSLVPFRDSQTVAEFWTDPIMLLFTAGAVIGAAEAKGWRGPIFRYPLFVSSAVTIPTISAFAYFGGGFPMQIQWQAVFAVTCILSVLVCTSPRASDGLFAEWLNKAGDASYSTYLFHVFVLMLMVSLFTRIPQSLQNPWLFVAVSIIAANIVGFFIYGAVERPLTNWVRSNVVLKKPLLQPVRWPPVE